LREILDRAGVDRGDARADQHPLGGKGQCRTLRDVAKAARHVDAGEAAALRLARDLQGLPPPPWHGNESKRGHRIGHSFSP
jgi:hypothetical protein